MNFGAGHGVQKRHSHNCSIGAILCPALQTITAVVVLWMASVIGFRLKAYLIIGHSNRALEKGMVGFVRMINQCICHLFEKRF